MMKTLVGSTILVTLTFLAAHARALSLDPDCTPEKAAKGAVAKATIGVGGRCSAGEVVKDSVKKAAGVESKGPVEKRLSKNDTPAEKARDALKKDK